MYTCTQHMYTLRIYSLIYTNVIGENYCCFVYQKSETENVTKDEHVLLIIQNIDITFGNLGNRKVEENKIAKHQTSLNIFCSFVPSTT